MKTSLGQRSSPFGAVALGIAAFFWPAVLVSALAENAFDLSTKASHAFNEATSRWADDFNRLASVVWDWLPTPLGVALAGSILAAMTARSLHALQVAQRTVDEVTQLADRFVLTKERCQIHRAAIASDDICWHVRIKNRSDYVMRSLEVQLWARSFTELGIARVSRDLLDEQSEAEVHIRLESGNPVSAPYGVSAKFRAAGALWIIDRTNETHFFSFLDLETRGLFPDRHHPDPVSDRPPARVHGDVHVYERWSGVREVWAGTVRRTRIVAELIRAARP